MKKQLILALIFILYTGYFTGCKKDKVTGEPPVLPPQETMIIDFSNFAALKKSSDLLIEQKGTENSSWEFAATVAGVWKLLINSTLAVPVNSFKKAAEQNPVSLDANTWQWSYSVSVLSATFKARLTGQTGTTDVLWKMYITKDDPDGFAEFLWFEGTSKLDGTGGQWEFNQGASSNVPMLQIDWTKTGTSVDYVKYTFIKNPDSFKTSYIEYRSTSGPFDAAFTIHYYNNLKFSDVNIEWDTANHNGRVKSLDYLLGEWYC